MSLTYKSSEGRTEFLHIGDIISKKSGKPVKAVYYREEAPSNEIITSIKLDNPDLEFESVPIIIKNQRNCLYISGASGSGKSYYAASYINKLQKLKDFKKQPVYFISFNVSDDPAYSDIKNFTKLDITNPENWGDLYDLDYSEFTDCIVVFDDWESSPKLIMEKLSHLQRQLLQLSRKANVTMINILHETQNFLESKYVITESTSYILFPKMNMNRSLKFLKSCMFFDQEQLDRFKKLEGRAVYINKIFPQFVLSKKELYLL